MLFLAEARARGRFALRWLKWLFWDRELRLWWGLALVVTIVGLLLLLPVTCHERQIRWTGVVLQLLGFAVVLRALLKDRKASGRPTLRLNLRQALARRPRLRTEARIMAATGVGHAISSGRARGVHRAPGGPLERRLELIEKELDDVYKELDDMHDKQRVQGQELSDKITAERNQREAEHQKLKQEFNEAVFGGISLDLVGVSLFVLGTVVSGVSAELALWLGSPSSCS